MRSNTTAVLEFTNFRGGYCTDVPLGEMADMEMQTADNVYWRDGLTKRGGKASYASISGCAIKGGIRARIKDVWYTILAASTTSSGTLLKVGTDTAYTNLEYPVSATVVQLESNTMVQFCYLDNKVGVVNGVDKPMVIHQLQSATNVCDTMDSYGTLDMDNADWKAGLHYATATAASTDVYLDYTTEAQSSASSSFTFATNSITCGWWVACNMPFNKATLYDTAAAATVSFTYSYYGKASLSASETWVSVTPITVPTWTIGGTKIVEFNIPTDPTTGERLMTQYPNSSYTIAGRYAFRARTEQTSTSVGLAQITLNHTQYLTQICLNDRPDTIAAHKSHIFLGFGNWLRVSPLNQFKNWREDQKEYFTEGGFIQQMVTHGDYLAILLDNAIYGVTGNSWVNFATQFLTSERGAASKRGAVIVGDELYFMARDGIYGWNGSRLIKVAKHIRTDLDAETASEAVAANWKGEAWFAFPTTGRVYIFDPDTFRTDDVGDGRVSIYRFPTYTVNMFMNYTGAEDNGRFMGVKNLAATAPRLERLEYDDVDLTSGATATIPVTIFTKYYDFGNPHQMKTFRRVKPRVIRSSTTVGGTYNLRFYRQDNFGGTSYTTSTISASTGTDEFTKDISMAPQMDGKSFALYVSHDAQTTAKFLGFAIEVEGRKF